MRPIQTRFPYGFSPEGLNQAVDDNSPDHYAKGTPSHHRRVATPNDASTACRHTVSGSPCTPLTGVLSIFQSPYLSTIGRQVVFSLTGWSPWIQSGFHVPRPTQVPLGRDSAFVYGAVTLCGPPFQSGSTSRSRSPILRPYNPAGKIPAVWATPLSLAATEGIEFSFFSSGY